MNIPSAIAGLGIDLATATPPRRSLVQSGRDSPLPTDIYDAALDRRADTRPAARARDAFSRRTHLAIHDGAADDAASPTTPKVPDAIDDLLSRLPDDVQAEVRRYVSGDIDASFYTPERTASRIAGFALTGFARFEGGAAAAEGTAEGRQRFVDFIRPAIERGYTEALDRLGELPDEVAAGLRETREHVDAQLDAFAETEPMDLEA